VEMLELSGSEIEETEGAWAANAAGSIVGGIRSGSVLLNKHSVYL
jgi:hypothetical protein